MKLLGRKMVTLIATVVLFALVIILSGCDVGVTVKGKAFYPNENEGHVWKSRQANPEKPIWSWGDASK